MTDELPDCCKQYDETINKIDSLDTKIEVIIDKMKTDEKRLFKLLIMAEKACKICEDLDYLRIEIREVNDSLIKKKDEIKQKRADIKMLTLEKGRLYKEADALGYERVNTWFFGQHYEWRKKTGINETEKIQNEIKEAVSKMG